MRDKNVIASHNLQNKILLLSKLEAHLISQVAFKDPGTLKSFDHHEMFFFFFCSIIQEEKQQVQTICFQVTDFSSEVSSS